MSIAIKIHNDFATFSNSITKRQFQFVTCDLKISDNGGGAGTLHVDCGQVGVNADRVFDLTASLEECGDAFDALAEYNELRVAQCHANAQLWDIAVDAAQLNIFTYPKA
jgi:hypothetical protein